MFSPISSIAAIRSGSGSGSGSRLGSSSIISFWPLSHGRKATLCSRSRSCSASALARTTFTLTLAPLCSRSAAARPLSTLTLPLALAPSLLHSPDTCQPTTTYPPASSRIPSLTPPFGGTLLFSTILHSVWSPPRTDAHTRFMSSLTPIRSLYIVSFFPILDSVLFVLRLEIFLNHRQKYDFIHKREQLERLSLHSSGWCRQKM